jgi:hypothetical protein
MIKITPQQWVALSDLHKALKDAYACGLSDLLKEGLDEYNALSDVQSTVEYLHRTTLERMTGEDKP